MRRGRGLWSFWRGIWGGKGGDWGCGSGSGFWIQGPADWERVAGVGLRFLGYARNDMGGYARNDMGVVGEG